LLSKRANFTRSLLESAFAATRVVHPLLPLRIGAAVGAANWTAALHKRTTQYSRRRSRTRAENVPQGNRQRRRFPRAGRKKSGLAFNIREKETASACVISDSPPPRTEDPLRVCTISLAKLPNIISAASFLSRNFKMERRLSTRQQNCYH